MILANFTLFRTNFSAGGTDLDGYATWPLANVRASGFDGGFTGIAKPITAFPVEPTVDGNNAGSPAHNAYLSQRTDDPALQWLSIVEKVGYTGTWTISLTAKCVSDLGLASATASLTQDELIRILNHCHLYVKRNSDGAIQWVDILRASLSDYYS